MGALMATKINPALLDAYREGQAAGHALSLGEDTPCPFLSTSGSWQAWLLGREHWRVDVKTELRSARGMNLWRDGERYHVDRDGIYPN
jgi:hypothetical protein